MNSPDPIPAGTAPAKPGFAMAILAGGLCLAFLVGCGQDGAASRPETELTGAPALAAPTTELLQRMVDAPKRVVFEATRRYEVHWQVEGVDEVLAYRESVVSDGQGGFAIDPLEVLESGMTAAEQDLFLLLQKAREGFFFKHRDFGIRDLQLFLAGWQVIDRGRTNVVGRSCALLDVRPQEGPARTYHLAVDDQIGLILRAEERDPRGKLVSRLDYESLNLSPSIAPEALHRNLTIERVVPSSSALRAALSFVPVQPKLIPRGYRLLETAAVVDPIQGEEWARYSYSDGVEELFFLHGKGAAEPGAPTGFGPGDGGARAQPNRGDRGVQAVRFLHVGPWTVLFGELDQGDFVAAGKVSRESLQDLVESAFF